MTRIIPSSVPRGPAVPSSLSIGTCSDAVNGLLGPTAADQPDDVTTKLRILDARGQWEEDASILLLGIRGTGKTSLAVLAATSIQFRLVDADQNFYNVTGLPRAAYASKYGFEEYRKREIALMQSLLENNPSRCIIVCGPGSAENTGKGLLEKFKKKHPVIYIMRDPGDIDRYLYTHDAAKISRLSKLVTPSYRSLSNFEFYNLSEPAVSQTDTASPGGQIQLHPSLTLKHVEYDFVRLVRGIKNLDSRPSLRQAQHSLSFLPTESKRFTYALTVPLEHVMEVAVQLRTTDLIVDALELVIDLDRLFPGNEAVDHTVATNITRQYYFLRRNVRLPVIFHVKLGGLNQTSSLSEPQSQRCWSTYLETVSHGLRLVPEYLTLDLRCDPEVAHQLIVGKGATKIIGHYSEQTSTSNSWDSTYRLQLLETADRWGCDLVRICQPATSLADNTALQRFISQAEASNVSRLPLIAYNTGRLGRASCFANPILTPVTHDLHGEPGLSNEEMLTVQAAQHALYASFILDPLVFGIFGSAVNSAMSPVMHNAAFKFSGMPHTYRTFQSSSLHDLENIIQNSNFGGASISAPFKQAIIPLLDHISPEAQAIGAVNTIIPLRERTLESLVDRNRAGPVVALYGDNTDWIGIHVCISRHLSPINAVKPRTTALILGAGGMAHAAVYAAIRHGVRNIFIYNRTLANAEKLATQFNGRSFSIHDIDLARTNKLETSPLKTESAAVHVFSSMDEPWHAGVDPPTIIVSCISRVSQDGQPLPDITLPDGWLRRPTGGVVIELAYNPVETPLIRQIQSLSSKGWIPVHGLQVLPEQGIAQFELFTGRPAPQRVMRSQVVEV